MNDEKKIAMSDMKMMTTKLSNLSTMLLCLQMEDCITEATFTYLNNDCLAVLEFITDIWRPLLEGKSVVADDR